MFVYFFLEKIQVCALLLHIYCSFTDFEIFTKVKPRKCDNARVKRGIQYSPCMLIQLFSPCAFNIFLNIHPCVLISDWLLIRESRVCRKIQLYKGDRILSLTLLIHPLPPIIYHQWMFQIEVHTNFFGFKRQMIYYGYQMSHIF